MRIGTANCRSHPLWLKHFDKEQIGVRLSSQSSSIWLLSLRRVFGPSSTWTWFYSLAVCRFQYYVCADSQRIKITTTVWVIFVSIFGYGLKLLTHPPFWVMATSFWLSCFLRPRSGWTLKVFEELSDQSVSNFPEIKAQCNTLERSVHVYAIYIYIYVCRRCACVCISINIYIYIFKL